MSIVYCNIFNVRNKFLKILDCNCALIAIESWLQLILIAIKFHCSWVLIVIVTDCNWFDCNWFDCNWFDCNWFDCNWFECNWVWLQMSLIAIVMIVVEPRGFHRRSEPLYIRSWAWVCLLVTLDRKAIF